MSQMIFRIKRNGETTVEVNGVQGGTCKDITKVFTDALGEVTAVEDKAEMYDAIDAIYTEIMETDD
jgi:hypothetical protein